MAAQTARQVTGQVGVAGLFDDDPARIALVPSDPDEGDSARAGGRR